MNKYELLIDIDYKPKRWNRWCEEFVSKLRFASINLGLEIGKVKVYETNKGLHIYIDVYSELKLNSKDICFIQLLLGSDYKRELFNWIRIRGRYRGKWNVLFINKERTTDYSRSVESRINRLISEREEKMST